LWNGATYNSWSAAIAAANFPFTNIMLQTVDLSSLPSAPVAGSSYSAWAAAIGGGIGNYDPGDTGSVNSWPVLLEYGLGTNPTTPTAGVLPGIDAPSNSQLGNHAIRILPVDGLNKNYLTMAFNFNREANDVEVVLAESTDLLKWEESVVFKPPFDDSSVLSGDEQVVEVQDNPGGNPVETTRVTVRASTALEDGATRQFMRLMVRPTVSVPADPAALSANSHDGVLLEWTASVQSGEYIIQRAASGSGLFVEIARTANRLYNDVTAVAGETFDYRVRAVNAAGASVWSNLVTIKREI
jgi:hypothetical protein